MAALLAAGLSGCTISTPAAGTAASTSVASSFKVAAPAGATVVVTVPQLAQASSPMSSVAGSPVSTMDSTTAGPTSDGGSASSPAGSLPPPALLTSTPAQTTSTTAPTTSSTSASAPATLSVKLANCPSCTVLGTHAGVTSNLGAALVATGPGRAALLALRADGSVAGVGNVVYGTTFPTQNEGQLACDSGSRCIVVAQQSDGTAIASAYQVSAAGVWSEVTGQPGIASVTGKAETLVVGGGMGVAVQDEADGTTVWIVYGWDGDRYGVKGCTTATTPDPKALTMDTCLS